MRGDDEPRLRSLTIYLLREGIKTAGAALRRPASLKVHEIQHGGRKLGELFVQQPRSHPPKWGDFFRDYLDLSILGRVSTSSAVLLVHSNKRLFALTFGQGRHLLQPGVWEERFGLRVVLNCIDENSLRSIDKHTFDTISRYTKVQASRAAAAPDFGLDVEQDLLRAATGSPRYQAFGHRLSGMDSLHTAISIELPDLRKLLALYLDKYHDTTYRESFPWVDHIAEVSSPVTVAALDAKLSRAVAEKKLDQCWLAVPEIVEWSEISGFRYGFRSRDAKHHDLHLPDFLSTLAPETEITLELLRNGHAYSIDLDDQPRHRWPIYRCLYCEVELDGSSFLLSGGKWYRVSRDFVDRVNDFYRQIPRFKRPLPEYSDSSEAAYCERVASSNSAVFALMDRKTIPIGGAYNKIEFCDLYTDAGELIHVKRYGGSSVLSHLFSQGVVSGETFRSDSQFRLAVNGLLPPTHKIPDPVRAPDTGRYHVVFAVVSDEPNSLTLPFFSRVNVKHAATRLRAYGYQVSLAKVSVSDLRSKLKVYRAK